MPHDSTRRFVSYSAVLALLGLVATFATDARAVMINTVPVGYAGNAGEVQSQGTFGGVAYAYRIGIYEVTNAQYVEFLNLKDATGANSLALYNSAMTSADLGGVNFTAGNANGSKYSVKSGRDNNPVNFVNWNDAIRFANWLNNGQGTGDTENGAYTLLGGTPTPSNGNSITRNAGATWFLTSEDEWYKAAYHKNDGATGNYWDYPTSTDAVPFSDRPTDSDAPTQSNTANFFKDDSVANFYDDGYAVTGSPSFDNSQNYLTNVGAYNFSLSPYGTFDQGGNVFEWNEALIGSSSRGLRGGAENTNSRNLQSSSRLNSINRLVETDNIGFRVANVPEPSTAVLAVLACVMLWWWRKRFQIRLEACPPKAERTEAATP